MRPEDLEAAAAARRPGARQRIWRLWLLVEGWLLRPLIAIASMAVLLPAVALMPKRRAQLVWGSTPIISNKYWARALRDAGWDSVTLMRGYYAAINSREDFDLYLDDLLPRWLRPQRLRKELAGYRGMLYVLRHAAVVHIPFEGGPLGKSSLWWAEAALLRWAGIKVVVMSYGGDAYRYSTVIDPSLRHALLLSYPAAARREDAIVRRVRYWVRRADVVLTGFQVDGFGRWDVASFNFFTIDTDSWAARASYSDADGVTGRVRIVHTPNHRGFKGTEFVVRAVEDLRAEGLDVELVLLERVQNEQVREIIGEADILVEQLIATAYAFNGIEGMASGLPVLANLEAEAYTRLFRRYSFLDECPILSTSPETLKQHLRVLVRSPDLRAALGRAGRTYVEKYHSDETAQYLFESIYDAILAGESVDLLNLFNPRRSPFNARRPPVEHPLVDSRFPAQDVTGDRWSPPRGGPRDPRMGSG